MHASVRNKRPGLFKKCVIGENRVVAIRSVVLQRLHIQN